MKIVFLGASITEAGTSPQGFITLIHEALIQHDPSLPIEIINAGIGGNKSTQMLARFQTDVLDQHPDFVTINVGLNDVWHNFHRDGSRLASGDSGEGVPIDVYELAIESMALQARKENIKVIFLSPTGIYEDPDSDENQRLANYVETQRQVAERTGAEFIDMFAKFRRVLAEFHAVGGPNELLLTTDGVHFNDAGNALMAAGWLESQGISPRNAIEPN